MHALGPSPSVDGKIDVTKEVCPMTYVRTKLALERLGQGQVLEVWVRGEEPVRSVPRSAQEEGHQVLVVEMLEEGMHRLLIRKG